MKKIINAADDVAREALEGYAECYKEWYEIHPEVNGIWLKNRRADKVALIVGGGSGHEPMFSGFVGKGLADAAACGDIFASPDPNTICETALALQPSKGILFLYGNYAGDNLNFDMAEEFLEEEKIASAHVRVNDDCASAPSERMDDRRGIAGDLFAIKIAGAACESGYDLKAAAAVTKRAVEQMRSIGIATSPGQIPGLDRPTFEIGDDEMEYGMGIHGEKGIKRTKLETADVIAEELFKKLQEELGLSCKDEICVLVNGLGSTTLLEMSIVYRRLNELFSALQVKIHDADINSYCTCQEMGGLSVTVLKLDDELKKLYDAPCCSPYYFKEGCVK